MSESTTPNDARFAVSRRQLIAGLGVGGAAAALAACGSSKSTTAPASSGEATTTTGAATTKAAAAATTAAPAKAGGAKGDLTFGSNFSNDKPKAAIEAMVGAFPNKDVKVKVNTTDHNTYQDNIVQYLQQPDDVISWFAGYRMRYFAGKGLVGDVSDVWKGLDGLGDSFKKASTGDDGKQYFVPLYYYPWGLHYRKSLFAEKGYKIPVTWDEFMALLDKMKTDGITPLVAANDGKWPQMGMFDQLNMRTNGYDFHVSLMAGKEKWTDERVMNVFKTWEKLIPLQQTGVNGRKWEDGAAALGAKEAGMYLIGTFLTGQYKDDATLNDIDFFAFPEIDKKHGQDAVEAPIDGFMMAAKPKNPEAAKAFLGYIGTAAAQEAYLKVDPSSVAASSKASTAGYNALQKKSAEFVGKAKQISQFMDRDTDPEFASKVMGDAIATFLTDPKTIADTLKSVEEKKATIFNK
jgi:multiple sugar transport system substrate-binding protein